MDCQATVSTESVVTALAKIAGEQHVDVSAESQEYHSGGLIPRTCQCHVIVHPDGADEVAAIVKYADQNGLKIWAYSTGRNWGYGTTQALQQGAIVMLLDRMNRIIEVNQELAYAVLEPGVTQAQLNAYLKENNIQLWMDCTDSTPLGSVIGNALERGVGYTPYGDHFGQLCGMDVVLADGQLVQMGGCQPGCHTFHTHKWGTGPFLDGVFSQSNMGIVTKAGIWLMPQPEEFNFMAVELRREEDLPRLINHIRELALARTIGNVHCFNPFLLLSARIQYPFDRRGDRTHLSEAEIRQLAKENHIAPYSVVCGVYGSKAEVAAHRKKVKEKLGSYCRLLFASDRKIKFVGKLCELLLSKKPPLPLHHRLLRWATRKFIYPGSPEALSLVPRVAGYHKGVPDEFVVSAAYFKRRGGRTGDVDPVRDDCGLLWLAPILPATSEHVQRLKDAITPIFDKHGFEFPLSIIMLNPRTLIFALPMFYDKQDPSECSRVQRLYQEVIDVSSELGYQQYRTGTMYLDRILDLNPGHRQIVRSLKHTLDPNNTLAPGKYGTEAETEGGSSPVQPVPSIATPAASSSQVAHL